MVSLLRARTLVTFSVGHSGQLSQVISILRTQAFSEHKHKLNKASSSPFNRVILAVITLARLLMVTWSNAHVYVWVYILATTNDRLLTAFHSLSVEISQQLKSWHENALSLCLSLSLSLPASLSLMLLPLNVTCKTSTHHFHALSWVIAGLNHPSDHFPKKAFFPSLVISIESLTKSLWTACVPGILKAAACDRERSLSACPAAIFESFGF